MKICAFLILLFFSSFQDQDCIDLSHTKFISVNCGISDCFRIISKCKFLKYKVYISNRGGKELLQFESKSSDIEEINNYMNSLRTTNDLESGTYYTKFYAYTYTDTIVKDFIFGLFKNSKIK
ncbi:MAG: hypothetical protein Q8L81_03280 [Bacteroidota bacterium]|nr:hypothetical protein [Bacteroidota bacterium]